MRHGISGGRAGPGAFIGASASQSCRCVARARGLCAGTVVSVVWSSSPHSFLFSPRPSQGPLARFGATAANEAMLSLVAEVSHWK